MAPNMETNASKSNQNNITRNPKKPSRLSMEGLQRTVSDISAELTKEQTIQTTTTTTSVTLPPISEIEDAKCECCGMSEECTPEYIGCIRERFSGRLICGLCSAAVMEEMERAGSSCEEALQAHMSACVRFNRIGRTHPVLYQAEAVREILKKSSKIRAKSLSPRNVGAPAATITATTTVNHQAKKNGIARSSSCISAIGDRTVANLVE